MKPLCLLFPLVLGLGGCSSFSSEVIHTRDGNLRAPSYVDAQNYCEARKQTSQPVGKAPGDTGILFRCE